MDASRRLETSRQGSEAVQNRRSSEDTEMPIDLLALLKEVQIELRHCRVFVTSREKSHPTGVELYDELAAKVDAAIVAFPEEARALEALKLARAWIERVEDQTMETALAVDKRCEDQGYAGYNDQYIAMCKAVLEALRVPQQRSE